MSDETQVVEPRTGMPAAEAATAPDVDLELTPSPKRDVVVSRWGLASDVVTRGTETLPEYERDQLRWLHRWAHAGNLSRSEVAERLVKPGREGGTYSADSLYQALTGRRTEQGAGLKNLADAIAALRRKIGETAPRMSTGFVETAATRAIFRLCRGAFKAHRLGFVFGPSQVGKSATVFEYARLHNHGETHLVRMPTRGGMSHFLAEMAEHCGIPVKIREVDLRRRIMESFDERTLLIIDEAHQALLGNRDAGAYTLEFIREIYDRRRCGVVLVGTEVLANALRTNRILSQLWRRRSPGLVLQLDQAGVSKADLAKFAAAFGLDEVPDRDVTVSYTTGEGGKHKFTHNPMALQTDLVREQGVGAWCKLLENARDLAELSRQPMGWTKVLLAYCIAKSQETTEGNHE